MALPYESAERTPERAEAHIRKMLRKFGVEGLAVHERDDETTIMFKHKGLSVKVPIRVEGYLGVLAERYPNSSDEVLVRKAERAAWSLAIDWLKANLVLVECEVMSFEEAFLGQVLLKGGQTMAEKLIPKLPQLTAGDEEEKS